MGLFNKLRTAFGVAASQDDGLEIGLASAYLKALEFGKDDAIELPDDPMLVLEPFVGDLCIGYVVDVGPALQFVQGKHLRRAGITEAGLHAIGVANLTTKLSDSDLSIQKMGEIYMLTFDTNFEASFMVADKLWDEVLAVHLPGDVVVAVPWRDVLIFCDASSAAGIEILKTQIEQLTDGTHRLSESLFVRERATRTWRVLEDS